MKKIILTGLLSCISLLVCKAQEINFRGNSDVIHYIYVGSLPKNSEGTYEKLKIEIFGGTYEASDLGTTVYSISTRTNNKINIERTGGGSNTFELSVYENPQSFDFIIKQTQRWSSLNIKSTLLKTNSRDQIEFSINIGIKMYDPTDKNDVTSKFTQLVLTATDKQGNFGIGTLTPQSKLDVRGKIIADEVEIKINKGADFVFEPDYSLLTLSEIENHIKENKHLPNIPSEKEMIKNGVNVNEMQIKLLQKIEELTLYVIELDKKDKEKNELIETLKKENQEIKEQLQNKN